MTNKTASKEGSISKIAVMQGWLAPSETKKVKTKIIPATLPQSFLIHTFAPEKP